MQQTPTNAENQCYHLTDGRALACYSRVHKTKYLGVMNIRTYDRGGISSLGRLVACYVRPFECTAPLIQYTALSSLTLFTGPLTNFDHFLMG